MIIALLKFAALIIQVNSMDWCCWPMVVGPAWVEHREIQLQLKIDSDRKKMFIVGPIRTLTRKGIVPRYGPSGPNIASKFNEIIEAFPYFLIILVNSCHTKET